MGAEQSKAEEGFRQKQEQTIKNMAEKIKQLELRQQTTSPARPARVAAHQPASAPSPITYSVSVAPHLELERQQQTIKSMMDKIKELESRQQQTIQAQAPAHQPAPRVEHAREVKEVAQTTQPMKINMISINDLAKTSSASRATEQHRSAVVSQKLRKEMNVPVVPIYPQKTEQLTREAVPSTSRNTLYPNLDNAKSSLSGLNKVQTKVYQPTFNPSTTTSWATNNDYVIIDNNKNTGRLEPTAPPPEQTTTTPEKQFTSKTYRSVSKTRKNAQTQSDKDEHLNCRTCQNNLGLKIFQCSKGHSSCHDCKMRGNNCGACGYPITDVRNIAVETYIAETKTTCPNKNNGCCLSFKLADIKFHLKECPYSDLNCPLDTFVEDCRWRGKLNNLGAHFQEEHPQYKNSVDTENTISDLRSNSWNLQFIQLGTFNFLVHFKISGDEDRVFMAVQLLGTGVSASKWRYEIHVYNKSNPRRKYQHTDVCTSHSVLASELFAEGLCASIPMSYAKSYGNFKNRLTYKIYIMKDEDVHTRGRGRGGRRGRGRGRSGSNTPRGESSYGNVSPNVFEDD